MSQLSNDQLRLLQQLREDVKRTQGHLTRIERLIDEHLVYPEGTNVPENEKSLDSMALFVHTISEPP